MTYPLRRFNNVNLIAHSATGISSSSHWLTTEYKMIKDFETFRQNSDQSIQNLEQGCSEMFKKINQSMKTSRTRHKKSNLEEALEEAAKGLVAGPFHSTEELMDDLLN